MKVDSGHIITAMAASLCHRFSILALLLLTVMPNQAQPTNTTSGLPPTVTSVSGCLDVGNVTTQCTFPAQLTIRGFAFLSALSTSDVSSYYTNYPCSWLVASLQPSILAIESGWSAPRLYPNAYSGQCNDTYAVFDLNNAGYDLYDYNQLLTLTIGSRLAGSSTTSASFLGLSLKQIPRPVITGISGCPGGVTNNGQTTSDCLPDRDTITLSGSGFTSWNRSLLYLVLGSSQVSVTVNGQGDGSLTLVSDSVVTFSLNFFYSILLQAHDFGGKPVSIVLQAPSTGIKVLNTVYAQFEPLPPPVITTVRLSANQDGACQWTDANKTALTGCVAGLSLIMWTGNYIYDMQVTIGGQPMSTLDWFGNSATNMYLALPVYDYETNVAYDVVFSNGNYTITWPSYITFSTAPAIPIIQGCRDSYWNSGITPAGGNLYCVLGETMKMQLVNAPVSQPPFIVTLITAAQNSSLTCLNSRYLTDSQIGCDVPSGGGISGGLNSIVIQWLNGASALATRFTTFDYPNAARITMLTGCGVTNSTILSLNQCQGGEVITLVGTRFSLINYTALLSRVPPYQLSSSAVCINTLIVDDSTATCELPYVEDLTWLNYDAPVYLRLSGQPRTGTASNYIVITFRSSPNNQGTGVSSGPNNAVSVSTITVILAVILSIVGCLLLLVTGAYLHRWRPIHQGSSRRFETHQRFAEEVNPSDSLDVELA